MKALCVCMYTAVLCPLLLVALNCVSAQLVINPPSNQTLPLGVNATFTCRTIGRVQWDITDTSVNQMLAVMLPLGDADLNGFAARGIYTTDTVINSSTTEYLSTLTLTTDGRNKTEVFCRAILNLAFILSQPATIILFGPPDPPTGLKALPGSFKELILTWTAPFILEGVHTNYTLIINNTDSAGGAQIISLNDTTYTFRTEAPSCDIYQFHVRASNAAGVSNTTEPVNAVVPTLPNTAVITESLHHSLEIVGGNVSCVITFQPLESCLQFSVTNYTVILNNTDRNTGREIGSFMFSMEQERAQLFINSSDGSINENMHYHYHIRAYNRIGFNDSATREFITTDVQQVTVSWGDNQSVEVECLFLQGSEALGCYVELTQDNEQTIRERISRLNYSFVARSEIALDLALSCYEVFVYDWEADNTAGTVPIPLEISYVSNTSVEHCRTTVSPPSTELPMPGQNILITAIVTSVVCGVLLIATLILIVTMVAICTKKARMKRDGGHTANTAPPSTTTGAAELFIRDNIAYGNLQANTNPEYERLDQPVHTYETLNQDEKMEDKPGHHGASMSYMPSD